MPNNQFINLEELSITTQALLSKINEQSNLKVNKHNVSAEYTEGTKIAEIEDVEIYAPIQEIDTSNFVTEDDLSAVAYTGDFNSLNNIPSLATVAHTGDYNNLSNKPDTSTFMVKGQDYVTAGRKSGTVEGNFSTAEGYNNTASGQYSHAEGYNNTASGQYSHAEGYYTTAQRRSQHVFGEYNILDTTGTTTSKGKYIEIVGKGTSTSARSNARTLDWNGNEVLAGKLTIGTAPTANMDVTTKQYVDGAISTAIGNVNSFNVNIVSGDLPTTNIDTHTIYFKSNSTTGSNVYDEYMYINDNWELIGSTAIDLTPYALSANLATVATSGDYDDLLDAPAAELDVNVENMLDNFNLDYTSNSINLNAAGVICKEITITDSGIVSQSLNAGCIYHFTGDLTELTITLNSTAGLAYYNFDFTTGSNVPVINLPNTVIMQDDYTISANKHYEISILNNYGAVAIWTN